MPRYGDVRTVHDEGALAVGTLDVVGKRRDRLDRSEHDIDVARTPPSHARCACARRSFAASQLRCAIVVSVANITASSSVSTASLARPSRPGRPRCRRRAGRHRRVEQLHVGPMQVRRGDGGPDLVVDLRTSSAEALGSVLDQSFTLLSTGATASSDHTPIRRSAMSGCCLESGELGAGDPSERGPGVRQHFEQDPQVTTRSAEGAEHAEIGRRQRPGRARDVATARHQSVGGLETEHAVDRAGWRIEPPMSLPISAVVNPQATAAPPRPTIRPRSA